MTLPHDPDAQHRYAATRFAMVPEWLLQHDLSGSEWQVYVAHRIFANAQTSEGWARRQLVADTARVSLATYKRAMTRLEQIGAVIRLGRSESGRGFRGYTYRLPFDEPAPKVNPQVTAGGSSGEPPARETPHSEGAGGSCSEPTGGSPGEPTGGSSGEPPREQTREQTREQKPSGGARAPRRAPADGPDALPGMPNPPAPKRRPRPEPEGAQVVIAAYVEAYEAAHGRRPIGRDIGKIGRDARAMVRDGESLPEMTEAARRMGRDGRWSNLPQQVALDRTGGRGPEQRGGLGPARPSAASKFADMPESELIDPREDRSPR